MTEQPDDQSLRAALTAPIEKPTRSASIRAFGKATLNALWNLKPTREGLRNAWSQELNDIKSLLPTRRDKSTASKTSTNRRYDPSVDTSSHMHGGIMNSKAGMMITVGGSLAALATAGWLATKLPDFVESNILSPMDQITTPVNTNE